MSIATAPIDADPSPAELIAARPHLSMHAMDGLLVEDVPLNRVADQVGTPTWVISAGCLRARARWLQQALLPVGASIHYAVKANDHLAVLRLLAGLGLGADVVSGGELRRALTAGIAAERIVFSGVGKQGWELRLALESGVGQLNIESAEELDQVAAIARAVGRRARVALRINPDVDAGTHAKITTGKADNKFGIPYADAPSVYAQAARLDGVEPVGLALHIGSQILTLGPYHAAYRRAAELVRALRNEGHRVEIVDCGGGLGIPYRNDPGPAPEAFARALRDSFGALGVKLAVEPGRWLVGPAGLLLASVVLRKGERFLVVDAAMNDLIRPAMYDAWHGVVPVGAADAVRPMAEWDVVGPVCESGDTFARRRRLPVLEPNARVALLDAGAYSAVMSSTYNARPLAAQVMVDGARWSVIRARQPVEAMWRDELVPDWIE